MKLFYFILLGAVCVSVIHYRYENAAVETISIPRNFVQADESSFQRKQGLVYYNLAPFSGWLYTLYKNGDTAMSSSFNKGRESGITKYWYENKQLSEIREYSNGKKTGVHKGWWPGGELKFEYHFKKDVFDGTVKEWFENGQCFRSMKYSSGYENGLQQIRRRDGKIYANYEARNGRNYGLTGSLHCKNTLVNAAK